MDRRIQHLIRRSVWIPVWKCNHKEPPLGLPNHNWHHPELHPWPVHLAHKITQWCVNFSHMIGSRIPYSEMMEEILKQYPCSNMAARPDEYVKFFIMPSTHQECASRPSAPALPRQDSFSRVPITPAFLRDERISILACMANLVGNSIQGVNTSILKKYVICFVVCFFFFFLVCIQMY